MAVRKRSGQGKKESDAIPGAAPGMSGQGTAGGREAHEIGSVDDARRAAERSGGRTHPAATNRLKDSERSAGNA